MQNTLCTVLPVDIGNIHFIGIGGIGMSGIAEILHNLGYKVQGSDLGESYITKRLEGLGIKVFKGHSPENVNSASLVVKSTAVKSTNPELAAALAAGIPVIKRSEMLAELMRFKHSIAISGTHGKTTTTSLVAKLFEEAGTNPTVINGGIINQHGTNAYLGSGDYLVAEADESDGTFIKVPAHVAVITNIDPEHLDYYGTFENAKLAFKTFIEQLPFYGFGVVCYDHPVVREICSTITDRKILTYGIESQDVDFKAVNIKQVEDGSIFDVVMSESYIAKKKPKYISIKEVKLSIHGIHNVLNALSAIAIGVEKNFSVETITKALANLGGVKRRFTKTGNVDGICFYDDYAHHPVEIKATLKTARHIANLRGGNLIAVMQPHRYTRLSNLMDDFSRCFTDANYVMISNVYAAGETPIEGASSKDLINNIEVNTKQKAVNFEDPENLPQMINDVAKSNDIVVFLGAGNITNWAYELPGKFEKIRKK